MNRVERRESLKQSLVVIIGTLHEHSEFLGSFADTEYLTGKGCRDHAQFLQRIAKSLENIQAEFVNPGIPGFDYLTIRVDTD